MTAIHAEGAESVLQTRHLGKEYKLYDSPRQRLLSLLVGGARHRSHWALRDVSFTLGRGQCLGVVGNNGAGKSSLLKLIAGTMQPSVGSLERKGRITAILELGAGFHPDFSGRDNLYFGASLIGISASEMRALEPEIIAFSELGEAIDRPVKTYSSGMSVRLAFALVTAVEPDVLIVDEALAVGDQRFQKKCIERIDAFRRSGCTILFCSHSLYHVRQLCDVALWLDHGQQRAFGDTESVLSVYEAHMRAQDRAAQEVSPNASLTERAATLASSRGPQDSAAPARLVSVKIEGLAEGDPPRLDAEDLVITMVGHVPEGEQPNFGVMLEQAHGAGITSAGTFNDGVAPTLVGEGMWQATIRFTQLPLHSGEYVVSAFLFDSQGLIVYEQWLHCASFRHLYALSTPGLVNLPHRWE